MSISIMDAIISIYYLRHHFLTFYNENIVKLKHFN